MSEITILIAFNIFVLLMLAIDLGIFQRKAHFPSIKEASIWSAVWIALSLLFAYFLYKQLGHIKALEFLTGYVIEKALSVDNIFVFVVIFSYFAVPAHLQHKILFWGVLGAVVFRTVFIVLGTALIQQFHWILYLFGVFLIYSAFKLAFQEETTVEPEKNPFIRYVRKHFPMTENYDEERFFVPRDSRRFITPLFLVLIMIETTDIAFATDSIPAIFAVTKDPIIVYTSNISAVLGLRALYFVLASVMKKFHYLQIGLSFVLGFIGLKMLVEPWLDVPISLSLAVIFIILGIAVLASILRSVRLQKRAPRDVS